jgi:sugar phosphate isomerase/epimerase
MKLGFVSAILHDLNLEDVLTFAKDEQFDCVELMSWPVGDAERKYAGITHINSTTLSKSQAEDILAQTTKFGVEISALGYYPNILCDDAEASQKYIEHLKKVIVAAKLLDLTVVNTFIGAEHTKGLEYNFAKFKKIWPDIIRFAEDQGITIGIENCPMLFTNDEWPSGKNLAYSPAVWRRMFEVIPSKHFGLNYDPSHLVWQMIDYMAPLQEFKDRIVHTHAKDLKINYPKLRDEGILALGWSTPKIPGYGEVEWNKYFSTLTDVGYAGAVCIEVEDVAFGKTLEGRKKALKISRNILRPFIERELV